MVARTWDLVRVPYINTLSNPSFTQIICIIVVLKGGVVILTISLVSNDPGLTKIHVVWAYPPSMLYLYLYNYISATGSVIYSGYIALFVIEKRVLHSAQCNLIVPCSSYCGTYTV